MAKTAAKKKPEVQKEAKEPRRGRRKEVNVQAPKAGGVKTLLDMAAALPAGEAKIFITTTMAIDRAEGNRNQFNKEIRGHRATLKGMKIDMWSYDLMRKFRKMAPEDAKARKISLALYEQQMSLELSDEQKATISEMDKKREEAKAALYEAHNGPAGKEVGSSAEQKPEEAAHGTNGANGSIDSAGPIPAKVPGINPAFGNGTESVGTAH